MADGLIIAPSVTESLNPEPEAVIEQAPSTEAPPATGEEPTDEKSEGKEFVSGSKKARAMGESRKKIAKTLIESAKQSPKAAATFKSAIDSDPDLAKYLKQHWPKDYEQIVEGKTAEESDFDLETVKIQAKAELLSEQIKEQKADEAYDFAEKLGFTSDEAEQLRELALKLEGTNLGGKTLDFEQALKRASYAVREDKAKAGAINLPSGVGITSDQISKETKFDSVATLGKKLSGRPIDQIKKNLKLIEENTKGTIFSLPME